MKIINKTNQNKSKENIEKLYNLYLDYYKKLIKSMQP